MLFNTLPYLLFLLGVLACYYLVKPKYRWGLLLVASYLFYMGWRVEYALLLAISTAVDYWAGLKMSACDSKPKRRPWLMLSLAVNFSFLFTFKYLDFFIEASNIALEGVLGLPPLPYAELVLPIGISFYTFQSLSYSIDVYRGDRKAETHWGIFALYVSFFPQLVSGPIERSSQLIPQLKARHPLLFENLSRGAQLILWGLFLKMVVADNLRIYVDEVFAQPHAYSGAPVLLGIYFFAMQVYCDFAGYTHIAIGSAALFGIRLSENFKRPYLAPSIREFWARWHITLTAWIRDYFYISLGGNKKGILRKEFNLYLMFLAVAVWHGTDSKLLLFGTLHYLYYLLQESAKQPFRNLLLRWGKGESPLFTKITPALITFHLVAFTWVVWWADDLDTALTLIRNAWLPNAYSWQGVQLTRDLSLLPICLISLGISGGIHILQGNRDSTSFLPNQNKGVRWAVIYLLLFCILLLSPSGESEAFIYFQF